MDTFSHAVSLLNFGPALATPQRVRDCCCGVSLVCPSASHQHTPLLRDTSSLPPSLVPQACREGPLLPRRCQFSSELNKARAHSMLGTQPKVLVTSSCKASHHSPARAQGGPLASPSLGPPGGLSTPPSGIPRPPQGCQGHVALCRGLRPSPGDRMTRLLEMPRCQRNSPGISERNHLVPL
uniref:Uncharacterized protein n=1 Tax=Gorilla gorilla gorilla TaxID=9595 RepID=A0A2I2ZDQ3_GORGO